MKQEPVTSIIVTCKNRLHHLKQTLPTLVHQSDAEVIVVDYGCAQGTAAWAQERYPAARIVLVDDDPVFCLSRARNAGARMARGRFFLFVDADVKVEKDVGCWVAGHARKGFFYRAPTPRENGLNGTVLCAKTAFEQIGGYDEAFRGWGGEDTDFYVRLIVAGIESGSLEDNSLALIEHDDGERQISFASGGMGTMSNAVFSNHLYMNIKNDFKNLAGIDIDLQARLEIMKKVKEAVLKVQQLGEGETHSLELHVGNTTFNGLDTAALFSKKLVYTLRKTV